MRQRWRVYVLFLFAVATGWGAVYSGNLLLYWAAGFLLGIFVSITIKPAVRGIFYGAE